MLREIPSKGGLSSHAKQRSAVLGLFSAAVIAVGTASSYGGTAVYDFTEDPTLDPNILINGDNDQPWQSTGGNPGGFLAVTYPQGNQEAAVIFPDIDDGKLVSAFRFEADLRIGNSTGDRAADGFSVSFARSNDRYLADPTNVETGFAGGGPAEFGTETGIAVSFDTWSDNVLPDGPDIEGIIVRIDNVTVNRTALPTRHGACNDNTSLQTGPRDAAYWTEGLADARAPESWATLCWQPFVIDLDSTGNLTVEWKGRKILDKLPTTYFPSAGQLVLAGRTGGANEHTHFDNIRLTTTAQEPDAVAPTAPGNFRSLETGSRRVLLTWDAATDNSGRVGYEVEQDGTVLPTTYVTNKIDIRGLTASTAYSFRVRATDVSGNKSAWVGPLTFTTPALVVDNVFATMQIYGTAAEPISGVAIDSLLFDPRFPATPDRVEAVRGLTFGEPAFGDTFGNDNGYRIAGTITPPVTGQYHFFVRADDQARLYVNAAGPAIPDPNADFPVAAEEAACCEAFKEPNPELGQPFETTSEPIQLTAGQRYGVLFLVKEGGGGDWGQAAWRRVGDTTPAASLAPIGYPAFIPETKPMVDAVGAVAEITQQPQDVTTFANEVVTLSARVNTASPYNSPVILQWFKNGVAISGANSTNYTIPVAAASDAGDYTLQVAVLGESATSEAATLTVNTDTKAPTVTGVRWLDPFTAAVNFSEPIQAPTAANFTLSGGVTVSAVQHNGSTVVLTTSRHTPDTEYTVTVTGVRDNANNTVAANATGTFRVPPFVPGKVKYEEWTNIGGTALAALRGDPRFPANPTSTTFLDSFEAVVDHANDYGAKMTAWYTPPANGSYVFFLSADDNAELFLSTDENPANKKLIAQETGWSATRNWVSSPGSDATAKRSDTFAGTEWAGGVGAPINLQTGQRYYVEMQFKEGGGGDNGSILILPAGTEPVNGDAPTGGTAFGSYVTSGGGGGDEPTIGITRTGGTISINFTGTLEGADNIMGPWSPVAGATDPYTVTTTGAPFRFFRSSE